MLWCQTDTQCKTVAVMVSYDSILHVCELYGHEVCREFLVNPTVVHMKRARAEQPAVSAAASFSGGNFRMKPPLTQCY